MKYPQLALLSLLMLPATAGADPGEDRATLDFALRGGESRTRFEYAGGESVKSTVRWAGASLHERVAPGLDLGFNLGYCFLSQTDRVLLAGIEPEGRYAGLEVRGILLDTTAMNVFADAAYTWRWLEHEESTQTIKLAWTESRLRLGLASASLDPVRLYAGALVQELHGEERANGDVTATTEFDGKRSSGGFAGASLAVRRNGYVGIEFSAGATRSTQLYFAARY